MFLPAWFPTPLPFPTFFLTSYTRKLLYCVPLFSQNAATDMLVRILHVLHHTIHTQASSSERCDAWGVCRLHGLWWSMGFLALYKPEAKLVGGMHVFVALMHDCHLCSLLKATVGKHHLLALPWYHSVRGRYLISSFLSLMLSSTCFKLSLGHNQQCVLCGRWAPSLFSPCFRIIN